MWRLARYHLVLAMTNADRSRDDSDAENGDGNKPDRRLQIMVRAHQWNIVMAVG